MLIDELIKLANDVRRIKTEGQTLEVKKAHDGCPHTLYDTLSSFSNQDSGGVLLFGLDEDGGFEICGVYDVHDLQKKVMEQCNQMEPPVRGIFTHAEIEGKMVCSVEIPGMDLSERPCYYKGTGRLRGAYIRVGDADLRMTDYELYSCEAFRKHLYDDIRPVERAGMNMLDADQLSAYVHLKRAERPGFARLSPEQAYEMLNISRGKVPTLAALMNFGLYPQGYFPQLAITAVVVPGTSIGNTTEDHIRFLDNKRIEGTLINMLDEAMAFCLRNMKTRTIIDPATGKRADQTEYPLLAIREAVLNALIHRDYSHYTEGTPIQINFFSDRLEIHSPGTLYGRMTVEQLGIARPDLRNPALAVMAETLLKAENRYSGIPTIRSEMAQAGLPPPVFENRRNEFVVTLYNRMSKPSIPARFSNDLAGFCSVPRTRQEIAGFLGVQANSYMMNHYVRPLLEKGILKMTLPDKPRSRNQKYYAPH
ncbi:MAG: putative DNA binding domain-containing protein [Clostridia bacterium]|nr:putative DNA binding domain-containing protein [Clostridia bacterium]